MVRIGYFADGIWAHNAFRKIVADPDFAIVFVCVRFDSQDETLRDLCSQYGIPYLRHQDINSNDFFETVSHYPADIFVSMSFNQIFRPRMIGLPPMKTVNCHAGKLPRYRGRNILNWALINGETEFGITVHYVDEGIDTGDIILQRTFPITEEDDYSTLLVTAHTECATVLYDALRMLAAGQAKPLRQCDISLYGMYCTQRKPGDEVLDWDQSSKEVFDFVRGVTTPGPCAAAKLNGTWMKIRKVTYIKSAPSYKCVVGAVIARDKDGFFVKTKDSFVKVTDFEYDGKVKIGDRFDV